MHPPSGQNICCGVNCVYLTVDHPVGSSFLQVSSSSIFQSGDPIHFHDPTNNCSTIVTAQALNIDHNNHWVGLNANTIVALSSGTCVCSGSAIPPPTSSSCVQKCGPCPGGQAGQATPLKNDCANAASSWSCCPTQVQCKSTTGKVFRVAAYGCDGYCYHETAIVNATTVTTRAPTTIEQNYINLYWPPSTNLYGTNCIAEVILIDGVPWWFANHKIVKYPDCGAWSGQDKLNNINHTKVKFAQAPWKAHICEGSASSSSGIPPTTTGCNSYCLREVSVEYNCTTNQSTVTMVSEDCYDQNNLPAPSTFGVSLFNEFFEDANCGTVVNGQKILFYKAVIIDSICTPQGSGSSCACGPVQRPIDQLFINWLRKNSSASCRCPSNSFTPPPPTQSSCYCNDCTAEVTNYTVYRENCVPPGGNANTANLYLQVTLTNGYRTAADSCCWFQGADLHYSIDGGQNWQPWGVGVNSLNWGGTNQQGKIHTVDLTAVNLPCGQPIQFKVRLHDNYCTPNAMGSFGPIYSTTINCTSSCSSSSSSSSSGSSSSPTSPTPPPPNPPPSSSNAYTKFAEYNCATLPRLARDMACDKDKMSCINPDRYVNIRTLPANGGQICQHDPHNTYHFVISQKSSNNNYTIPSCSPNPTNNLNSDGCYLYMLVDDGCPDNTLPVLDFNCYYNIHNCCDCQSSHSCSSLSSLSSASPVVQPSPSALQLPGKYCYAQNFQVINFYSKPKCSITAINSSTTCAAVDSTGAEYAVKKPGPETITLKVPRLYNTSEVYGKWVILEDGCGDHKYYRIIKAWDAVPSSSSNSGGTP